ncbi:Hypothetical Protein FCC1311_057442 [Hondaea fermentalgiana]|uniref:Uncharacterized protein n=1 Tax=Hondaea fermentalgiana TaxID=2315210 RepID=A0A2R5GLM1_9STRA|nr:Hypothetical Protein FCC1311_057442 [Hondaea fermentalgiana]|eukprot:GBG29523.1 Hypothetical Protein FCC1311_057442 [Hondaea fermentalgiana]
MIKRSSVEILHTEVLKNPFYPFQLGLSLEDRSRVFTLRVPYKRKRPALAIVIVCFAVIISMLATNNANSSIFVYVLVALIQSAAVFLNYRHERIYLLDEENKTYSFIVGPDSVTSDYHNIYIRLNRKMQVGMRDNEVPRYNLVLDGVKIDKYKLNKRPTTDVRALRK